MSEQATISSAVLMGLYDSVCAQGVDPLSASQAAGLAKSVWFDSDEEVPLAGFVDTLECIAEMSGNPDFGWRAGETFDLRFIGELGEAILNAPTVGMALKTFCDNLRLVQTTSDLNFEVDGDRVTLSYRILDPDIWPRCQDAEFTISILRNMLSIGQSDCAQDVRMMFEHRARRAACKELQDPTYDGHINLMTLPTRLLDIPRSTGSRQGWQQQSKRLQRALSERNRSRPVSAKTETSVLRLLGYEKPTQSRVAEELGLSDRSLHRRLDAEGTTFSRILADCRLRLAKHMLAHGQKPLCQIALDLGYDDQSCFSRAFRKSTGVSPSRFKARHAERNFNEMT